MNEQDSRLWFIEPDGSNREAIRKLGYRFIDLLVESGSRASSRPPVPEPEDSQAVLSRPYSPSAAGRPADELIRLLKEEVLDHVLNPAHPGYVGHMDTLASAIGIFSDAVVSACNNNMLSYEMSLAFTEMESAVLEWATALFGFGEEARGLLVSGGTLANVQAIWTARNAILEGDPASQGLSGSDQRPVLIVSEHAHYSFLKAANLTGIGREGILYVPTGDDGRVTPEAIEGTIQEARRQGLTPFCVVGIAGTTITGTIEPLEQIGRIAKRERLWFHVDAAYGGSIALSSRLRKLLAGIETADSITWNPQKWLFIPKTCASVLYRDGSVLGRTVQEPFVYGRENGNGAHPNLGEFTIQGTRRVDIVKFWLTLEHLGTERLARFVEESVERAKRFADSIRNSPELELIVDPHLSIVCFRAVAPGIDPADTERMNALQVAVQQGVARRGHGWLSLPSYRGKRILRAVILHPRCEDSVLGRLLDDVRETVRAFSP